LTEEQQRQLTNIMATTHNNMRLTDYQQNQLDNIMKDVKLSPAQQEQLNALKGELNNILKNPPSLPTPPVVNSEYSKLYNQAMGLKETRTIGGGGTTVPAPPVVDLPQVSCSTEISKMQKQMEQQIAQLKHELASRPIVQDDTSMTKRYYDSLLSQLKELNVLTSDDVNNMNLKLSTGVMTLTEAITSLENLKNANTSRINKFDYQYNVPADKFGSITEGLDGLDVNKWRVPTARPPICINTQPCKVCPDDVGYSNAPSSNALKIEDWNSSLVSGESKH
jgi:hypothetical protein